MKRESGVKAWNKENFVDNDVQLKKREKTVRKKKMVLAMRKG